jgi:hypothetical protein
MKKSYFLWSLLGMLTLQLGWAQQKTITGAVNDETGLPLPGATVVVDGTTRGVATDFDGNFSIQADEGEILVFTYVGYADQRITVGSEDSYTINLAPDNLLEEVVLTALGLEKKKDDDLSSTSVVQVDQLRKSEESGILHDLRRTRNFIDVPNKTTGSTGASDFPQRFLYPQSEVDTNENVPSPLPEFFSTTELLGRSY